MNPLQIFQYNNNNVRVVMINNDPWWVAGDVCAALGIGNITDTIARLDENDFDIVEVEDSAGRNQRSYVVNEFGLYDVIFLSRKLEAKVFKRWITHEVLPSIRKTGGYQCPSDPLDQIIALADHCKRLAVENKTLNLQIVEQAPKVLLANDLMDTNNILTMMAAAKELGIGRNKLFALLRDNEITAKSNLPYQQYIDAGYFEVKAHIVKMGGNSINYPQTYVTARGMAYIHKRFFAQNVVDVRAVA